MATRSFCILMLNLHFELYIILVGPIRPKPTIIVAMVVSLVSLYKL